MSGSEGERSASGSEDEESGDGLISRSVSRYVFYCSTRRCSCPYCYTTRPLYIRDCAQSPSIPIPIPLSIQLAERIPKAVTFRLGQMVLAARVTLHPRLMEWQQSSKTTLQGKANRTDYDFGCV